MPSAAMSQFMSATIEHRAEASSFLLNSEEQASCGNRDGSFIKEEPSSRSDSPTPSKSEQFQNIISRSLDVESRKKISSLLNEIQLLSDVEKLFLYIQLPTSSKSSASTLLSGIAGGDSLLATATNGARDNPKLKNPGTGKKAELEAAQTYAWIRTHLAEDPAYSLPKQEVYDDYKQFAQAHKFDALCVADFGKAMKQVFPGVKPRRLGQRGNSKYCYSGLKKKFSIETHAPPKLDLHTKLGYGSSRLDHLLSSVTTTDLISLIQEGESPEGESLGSLFDLILHWAESVSNVHFHSVRDFLLFLMKDSANHSGNGSDNIFQPSPTSRPLAVRCHSVPGEHAFQTEGRKHTATSASENLEKISQSMETSTSASSRSRIGGNSHGVRSKSFSNGSPGNLSDDMSAPFFLATSRNSVFRETNSTHRKYKKIQPKQGQNSLSLPHPPTFHSPLSTTDSFPSSFVVVSSMSSAPPTVASSPTDFHPSSASVSLADISLESKKRRFSGPESSVDASPSSNSCHLSLEPLHYRQPRKKQRKLASIQPLHKPLILSSTSTSISTDSGIETPGSSGLTFNGSVEGTQEGTFPEHYATNEQLPPPIGMDDSSSCCPSTETLSMVGGGENNGNCGMPTEAQSALLRQGTLQSIAALPSSGPDCVNAVDLECQSALDKQQLSQLRKLLEQNLPHNLRDAHSLPSSGSSLTHSSPGTATGALTTVDPSTGVDNVFGSFDFSNQTAMPNSHTTQFMSDEITSDPSSHCISLSESPSTLSRRNSPSMSQTQSQQVKGEHMEDKNSYVFQPIPHRMSPAPLLSDAVLLNDPPLHSGAVQSITDVASSSSSTGSSPTSTPVDWSRSRNESGQSLFSGSTQVHTLDSGVSSISSSPFISPQATPLPGTIGTRSRNCSGPSAGQRNALSRTRHSSGPGHFANSYRPPVMRTHSFSPMTTELRSDTELRSEFSVQSSNQCGAFHSVSNPSGLLTGVNENRLNRNRHFSSPFFPSTGHEALHKQALSTPFHRSHSVPAYEHLDLSGLLNETTSSSLLSSCLEGEQALQHAPTNGVRDEPSWGRSRAQRNITHLLSLPPSLEADQDLQTTLDDLRDCDNDFSRFAQELEAQSDSLHDPSGDAVLQTDF